MLAEHSQSACDRQSASDLRRHTEHQIPNNSFGYGAASMPWRLSTRRKDHPRQRLHGVTNGYRHGNSDSNSNSNSQRYSNGNGYSYSTATATATATASATPTARVTPTPRPTPTPRSAPARGLVPRLRRDHRNARRSLRFSRSTTGDERSLTEFAPLRVHAAASRCAFVSRSPIDPAWRGQSQEMGQNCVDTRKRIQIQGRSTFETQGSKARNTKVVNPLLRVSTKAPLIPNSIQ